jgi:hypothetical protein
MLHISLGCSSAFASACNARFGGRGSASQLPSRPGAKQKQPHSKKAQTEQRTLVFTDESGFYLLPAAVRTYAPIGQTPVLTQTLTRDHR